jgi:hypothetical protein
MTLALKSFILRDSFRFSTSACGKKSTLKRLTLAYRFMQMMMMMMMIIIIIIILHSPFHLLTVYIDYVLRYFDLSLNTRLLSGIQLRQLMPTNWNASNRSLRPSVVIVFFPKVHYNYSLASEELKLHTLSVRRHRLDALFLIQVYLDSKFSPSVLEIAGLRVPSWHIRDCALFNVCSSSKNCPSARCHQLLILFAGTLTCLELKTFCLIVLYNGPCIVLEH